MKWCIKKEKEILALKYSLFILYNILDHYWSYCQALYNDLSACEIKNISAFKNSYFSNEIKSHLL